MRIIAGKFGSRRLHTGRGLALRPTSDRLRETLFDILQTRIAGSYFVDGYAGTGAAGIEALSRGARHVVFLESHRASVKLIRENLASLGISEGAEVLPIDVCRGLATLAGRGEPADILFFDPPYAQVEEYERVLDALAGSPLAGPGSLLIFERARKVTLPAVHGTFVRTRTVPQGDAALDFYSAGPE
jgi:16S rRNA (guanine(966)-N(2))-methyltransferase RsmD